jgi:hypothetical protein
MGNLRHCEFVMNLTSTSDIWLCSDLFNVINFKTYVWNFNKWTSEANLEKIVEKSPRNLGSYSNVLHCSLIYLSNMFHLIEDVPWRTGRKSAAHIEQKCPINDNGFDIVIELNASGASWNCCNSTKFCLYALYGCVVLQCLVVNMPNTQVLNTQASISCTVSAMEVVELLWCVSADISISQNISEWDRLVPSCERKYNANTMAGEEYVLAAVGRNPSTPLSRNSRTTGVVLRTCNTLIVWEVSDE